MTDAYQQLVRLYQRWSDWTTAESEAIESSNWPHLEESQRQKVLLQKEILRQERLLDQSPADQGWRQSLRSLLEKLMQRERHNQELLHRKRVVAEQQRTQAQAVGRTLRRLHGAYVPAQATGWQSYS